MKQPNSLIARGLCIWGILAPSMIWAGGPAAPTPVTVIPFTALKGQEQAWLSKGVADLFSRRLSEVPSLAVLDRNTLLAYTREAALSETGLVDQEKALRVGRVAKVDEVVYGNYSVKGNRLEITVFLLDLKTQTILRVEKTEGPLVQLETLVNQLALKLLKNRGVALTEEQRAKIQFHATDSFDATEHFYRGLDLADRGLDADAFGEFAAAAQKDPRFLDAQLWMGRLFESQGYFRQAVLTYKNVFKAAPQEVEGLDGLFLAGTVLEDRLKNPAEALKEYDALWRAAPQSPHGLEASYRSANLLDKRGDRMKSYWAYRRVDLFHERVQKNPDWDYRSPLRSSFVLPWAHALQLYQNAVIKMVSLYPALINEIPAPRRPPPPRGMFIVNPDSPEIVEPHFGDLPSLFYPKTEIGHYRERFYAVAVPAGIVATGVDVEMTGKLLDQQPYHSYDLRVLPLPIPKDYSQNWIGALVGQTDSVQTLKKSVPFYGKKLRAFALAISESNADLSRWKIRVHLALGQPEKTVTAQVSDHFSVGKPHPLPDPLPPAGEGEWEGRPLGAVPLPEETFTGGARTYYESIDRPKKELALINDRYGRTHVVTVMGELDGTQTDLWISHSVDGKTWSPLEILPVNSAAEDYNPKLVRLENGQLLLGWISTRRGKGWELWTSLSADGKDWSAPQRVPLEQGAALPTDPANLLEYDLWQDTHGRWGTAFYSSLSRELILLDSADGTDWKRSAKIPADSPVYGLALTQDSSAVYRLMGLNENGKINLWSSNDGLGWTEKTFSISSWNQWFFPSPKAQRLALFSQGLGDLLLLASDNTYGLQFSRFHPETDTPRLDLVARAALQPYAATEFDGGTLVALKEGERIVFRHYRGFSIGEPAEHDTENWPIYVESETGPNGTWRRISAQARDRVSDVSSLAVEPSGRVWWGIESGIMSTDGTDFFASDVSQGFFNNNVTGISACNDGKTWFWSDTLEKPLVGSVTGRSPSYGFYTLSLPNAVGSVTTLACGKTGGFFAGTSEGTIVKKEQGFVQIQPPTPVTVSAVNPRDGALWFGTEDGRLYRMGTPPTPIAWPDKSARAVTAMAFDAKGTLWVARQYDGLFSFDGHRWTPLAPGTQGMPYMTLSHLRGDPKEGIWFLPGPSEIPAGLGFYDGTRVSLFHPPHSPLPAASALDLDARGHIWIGTPFDGVYEFVRNP